MKQKKKNKEKDIEFKKNLKKYFELAKPYKWYLVAIILTVLVVSVTRVADKFIFKVLIDEGTKFTSGEILIDAFIYILLILLVVYFSLMFIRVLGGWIKLHLTNRYSTNIMRDMKKNYFNHIVHLDHEFHTTHKTGSLISRLTRGSWALDGLTDFFVFNGAPLILQMSVAAISVLYFDFLSAIVVVIMSVLFIGYSLFLINKQRKLRIIANDAEDLEKANISDVFTNIDSIKYYGKEDRVKKIFSKLTEDTRNKFKRNWDYFRWLDAGHGIIIGLGLFFLIYFPLLKFLDGEITLGTLVFLYTVFGTLAEPLFGFVWGVRGYYESMANLQSLFDYDKFKNKIEDKPNASRLKVQKGEIEFKNIGFTYKGKKNRAVHNINLNVKPNEKIALVGHSGCGKTTLVKLLYRFFDVDSGEILIDGKNIKDFKQ
jgi:ATP-binding cassette, subfamily B, heavy metal transporter